MATGKTRKYEFAVLVVIIAVLALLLMRALEWAREEVEEAAVQSEAAALRIELLDRLAHREAQGGKLPASNNPLRWVRRVPENYRGEFDVPPEENAVWYFDRRHDELVYRFHSGREARFRLERGLGAAPGAENVPARLAGVGLRRVDRPGTGVK